MPFEPFTPKMACAVGRSINDRISATLGRSGYLSYTALAAREFGLKAGMLVLVYFDPQAQRIAIKPANGGQSHNAFALNSGGDKESGTVKFSIRGLCKYYQIDTTETRRYEPFRELNTGMIVVDLKAPTETVTRKAAAK